MMGTSRQRVASVGSCCSVAWASPAPADFLRGDADALMAVESFLSRHREAYADGSGYLDIPFRSVSGGAPQASHGAPASSACVLSVDTGSRSCGQESPPAAACGVDVDVAMDVAPGLVFLDARPLDAHAPDQMTAERASPPTRDAGSPATVDAASLGALLRQFRLRFDDPLLPLADPKVVRRRLFQVSQPSARRSRRLAAKMKGMSAVKRAQRTLMDKLGESRPLQPLERELRRSLKARVLGLASLECTIARQHARVVGLQDGDAAAQFFHSQASKRRRRNHISVLRSGERLAATQEDKEDLAAEFFAELLGRPRPWDHEISLGALGLDAVDLSGLDAHFSEDEVWATVKAMPANKSPGPDGLSWDFFRSCWAIVKADILDAVMVISTGRDQHLHRLNTAFVTLIPKKEGASELTDFRPISLVHSFAKLITKIMALRLAPRMAGLVDFNQSAFIRGR
ncbi:hypothetical protein ACQ4PT_029162 [Festuca glaucescens]